MQQTLNEPQLQQQPRRLQTADFQLQSANGKSQWVNNFWTFCSSRLASTWLPACHLWAAFSFPFHIGSRAYDLASFSLFSKLKLNFHLNTCPALWSLTRANIGSTHTHSCLADYKLCQTRFWPAQLMTKNLLVSVFYALYSEIVNRSSLKVNWVLWRREIGFAGERAQVMWIAKGAGNSETGTDNSKHAYAEQENVAKRPLRNWPKAQPKAKLCRSIMSSYNFRGLLEFWLDMTSYFYDTVDILWRNYNYKQSTNI